MKKFIEEFKAFIKKGNVMDLAVGVIIGAAFGKIVTSLVNDMLTPFIVLAVGKTSLKELSWVIRAAVIENGEVITPALTVNWGNFLQTILDFLIIAFVIFMVVRTVVKAKTAGEKLSKNTKRIIKKIERLNPFDHGHSDAESSANQLSEQGAQTDAVSGEQEQVSAVLQNDGEGTEVLENEQKSASNIELLLTEIRDALKSK